MPYFLLLHSLKADSEQQWKVPNKFLYTKGSISCQHEHLFLLKIAVSIRWHVAFHLRLNGMQNQTEYFSQIIVFIALWNHLCWKWPVPSPGKILGTFWGQGHVQDMSLKCPRTFMPKKSVAPKSFEDICPVLSFLEDII